MIDENITFIMFGYTSNELSYGSGKKVWKICDVCKEERLIPYRKYRDLCHACSTKTKEFRLKRSESKIGTHHSKETKLKMSKSQSGENNPMFGKRGESSGGWKGGKKLANARSRAKRKLFRFIQHNKPQKNFHGHHVDFNHVIFIPKKLHQSIWHSVTKNINMEEINDIVCDWYLKDQIT